MQPNVSEINRKHWYCFCFVFEAVFNIFLYVCVTVFSVWVGDLFETSTLKSMDTKWLALEKENWQTQTSCQMHLSPQYEASNVSKRAQKTNVENTTEKAITMTRPIIK